jgi:hypothetical protein
MIARDLSPTGFGSSANDPPFLPPIKPMTEQQIQKAVFQHLRQRGAPGVFAFHPANGGYRKPKEAAIFKGLGVVSGVPDVIAIHKGQIYGLELKAKDGKVTEQQLEALARMKAAGAIATIAVGLDEALRCLELWGLLKGATA